MIKAYNSGASPGQDRTDVILLPMDVASVFRCDGKVDTAHAPGHPTARAASALSPGSALGGSVRYRACPAPGRSGGGDRSSGQSTTAVASALASNSSSTRT